MPTACRRVDAPGHLGISSRRASFLFWDYDRAIIGKLYWRASSGPGADADVHASYRPVTAGSTWRGRTPSPRQCLLVTMMLGSARPVYHRHRWPVRDWPHLPNRRPRRRRCVIVGRGTHLARPSLH
jgi:hypothetical protein